MKVGLSVVVYKHSFADLLKLYESIRHTEIDWCLYVVNNSPVDELAEIKQIDDRIIYIFNDSNIGFGAAHNIAIELAMEAGLPYHFVINPDIYFNTDVVTSMVNYMATHPDVGMMMPEVLYPNGDIQYLPKLLPNPFWIIKRKLKSSSAAYQQFITNYELRHFPTNKIYNAPILSGCFSLLNLNAIRETGKYDDKFFMYFEDFDLSRRIHKKYKTVYYPEVSVFHEYESGANKKFKLFKIFLFSAWHYFNKWGWFFDKDRKLINDAILKQMD